MTRDFLWTIQTERMNIACTICLDRFFLSSTISASPCGHLFHDKCLDRWLIDERKKTCPQCRTPITPKQILKYESLQHGPFHPRFVSENSTWWNRCVKVRCRRVATILPNWCNGWKVRRRRFSNRNNVVAKRWTTYRRAKNVDWPLRPMLRPYENTWLINRPNTNEWSRNAMRKSTCWSNNTNMPISRIRKTIRLNPCRTKSPSTETSTWFTRVWPVRSRWNYRKWSVRVRRFKTKTDWSKNWFVTTSFSRKNIAKCPMTNRISLAISIVSPPNARKCSRTNDRQSNGTTLSWPWRSHALPFSQMNSTDDTRQELASVRHQLESYQSRINELESRLVHQQKKNPIPKKPSFIEEESSKDDDETDSNMIDLTNVPEPLSTQHFSTTSSAIDILNSIIQGTTGGDLSAGTKKQKVRRLDDDGEENEDYLVRPLVAPRENFQRSFNKFGGHSAPFTRRLSSGPTFKSKARLNKAKPTRNNHKITTFFDLNWSSSELFISSSLRWGSHSNKTISAQWEVIVTVFGSDVSIVHFHFVS